MTTQCEDLTRNMKRSSVNGLRNSGLTHSVQNKPRSWMMTFWSRLFIGWKSVLNTTVSAIIAIPYLPVRMSILCQSTKGQSLHGHNNHFPCHDVEWLVCQVERKSQQTIVRHHSMVKHENLTHSIARKDKYRYNHWVWHYLEHGNAAHPKRTRAGQDAENGLKLCCDVW